MKLKNLGSNLWEILVDDGSRPLTLVGYVSKVSYGWRAESLNQQVVREHRSMVKAAERVVAALASSVGKQ